MSDITDPASRHKLTEAEAELRFFTTADRRHGLSPRYSDHALVGKQCIYADSQIYQTPDADNFRRELRNLWKINQHNRLSIVPLARLAEHPNSPLVPTSYVYTNIKSRTNNKISKVVFGTSNATVINNTFYNKRSMPMRVVGSPDFFQTDEQWRTYVAGGIYNEVEHNGLIPKIQIADHLHSSVVPMTEDQLEKYNLGDTKIKYFADFNMSYNLYNSKFESKSNQIKEIALPNYYALWASSKVDLGKTTRKDLIGKKLDYVIDEITGEEVLAPGPAVPVGSDKDASYPAALYRDATWYRHAILNNHIHPGRVAGMFRERKKDSDDSSVVRTTKQELAMAKYIEGYSNKIQQAVIANPEIYNHMRNVFFDIDAADEYLKERTSAQKIAKLFPMNINLRMRTEQPGLFINMLESSNLDGKFMLGLHHGFAGESDVYKTRKRSFVKTTEEPIEKVDEEGFSYNLFVHESEEVNLNCMNLFSWWDSGYRNPGSFQNINFVGRSTESVKLATDAKNRYRFENTTKHLKFASQLRKFFEDKFDTTNRNYIDVLKATPSYVETVAYRIVKRGGGPEGPNKLTPIIQNFWIMNSKRMDVMSFFDTQVKYGENYRYDVYAYKVVIGTKYKYKNLRLSKRISGEVNAGRVDSNGEPLEETCLSFYDSETGEDAAPLAKFDLISPADTVYTKTEIIGDIEMPREVVGGTGRLPGVTMAELAGFGFRLSPDHIQVSPDPFLADFEIEYEPSAEIIEVPLFAYRGTPVENPTSQPGVEIFKVENKENSMAFRLRFDDIPTTEVPRIVTGADEEYRRKYLLSNGLPTNAEIKYDSVSAIIGLEVYRTERVPQLWSDFDGEMHNFIRTRPGTSNHVFIEKIKTNTKYYYMFRSVDSHNTPGQCSEIYEVELLKKGEITYPVVKVHEIPTRDELSKRMQQLSKSIRRLVRISPSVTQRVLNNDKLSKYETGYEAMRHVRMGEENKYTIWDQQKFKIRLTSKKTGRKIDLNVKFKTNNIEKAREPDSALESSPSTGATVLLSAPLPDGEDSVEIGD
jgi:hypothetical protein